MKRLILTSASGFGLHGAGLADLVIHFCFRFAWGQLPSPDELSWGLQFLKDQSENHRADKAAPNQSEREALVNLCQMVLNTSEFLYQN